MRSLVVDDSRLSATALVRVLERVDPAGECRTALTGAEALKACESSQIDVVFLDIEMPGTNGLELARKLKVCAPSTHVVFVTGYPEYALDAWQTQARGFLVKPVEDTDLLRVIEALHIETRVVRQPGGISIHCFGNFEVFCDGEPVDFERHQTKELLAYLVDRRGTLVSMGELVTVLWEGLPDTASRRSQLRTLISDLRRTLDGLGHPDVIVKRRGSVAIRAAAVQCDYFDFLRGSPEGINAYKGEYMCQYSWAEATSALLVSRGIGGF